MAVLKIWFVLPFVLLGTGICRAGAIPFERIPGLVDQKNRKLRAFDALVRSEEKTTGRLARSFLPEVTFSGGLEDFHSDRLGDRSSGFYGAEAKANVFNGLSDYWEEEKRESRVRLAKADRRLSLGELIFEARQSYLKLAEAKIVKAELNDSLNRLDDVFKKVRKKVSGGVISTSDLTSLRLVQVEFEHEAKDLEGEIAVELARLRTLLGVESLGIDDIDEKVLRLETEAGRGTPANPALAEKYKAESEVFAAEGNVLSGKQLPGVELFANYGRRPFSEREFTEASDREEWAAGVQLTWKLGGAWESGRQARAARLRSSAAERLSEYHADEIAGRIGALENKRRLLVESAQGLEREIGLSRDYYSQISSEYLRGVKSTSDLTSTFEQLLELKKHRVRLVFQYQSASAEIKSLTGEN